MDRGYAWSELLWRPASSLPRRLASSRDPVLHSYRRVLYLASPINVTFMPGYETSAIGFRELQASGPARVECLGRAFKRAT